MKLKESKKKTFRLINPLNQEEWFCENYDDVKVVDGVEYVKVHKIETPFRTHFMRKEALRKVTAS